MVRYTVQEFVDSTAQDEKAQGLFELESAHMLEVNLSGRVWAKKGAMVGYTGNVRFTREGMMEHGISRFFKKMVSGEGTSLMKMEGHGRVYLADVGKRVQILHLENDVIFVNGNDLLAMQDGLDWDIKLMRKAAGMLSGGLFNVRIQGTGMIAITSHYQPLTLKVSPGQPVFTDPNATVAWSSSLAPEIHTDITVRSLLGRGSGEGFQMKFQGTGWVVLQPYEEVRWMGKAS